MMQRFMLHRGSACYRACTRAGLPSLTAACRAASSEVPERRLLYVHDNFLNGTSAMFLENLYHDWKKNPSSVDPSWAEIFASREFHDYEKALLDSPLYVAPSADSSDPNAVKQSLGDCVRLTWMIRVFEERGHFVAQTDPLALGEDYLLHHTPANAMRANLRLDLAHFGFSAVDAERVVRVGFQDKVGGVFNTGSPAMKVRELHELLTQWYCGPIGFEMQHIVDAAEQSFIRSHIQLNDEANSLRRSFSAEEKRHIWEVVASAVHFEDFFKRKFATQKRFGCDGAETLVLGLRTLLESSSQLGVERINLGMAHRGRLNVLYHIIGKPFEVILKEFTGITGAELAPYRIQSDVKYHLGARSQLPLSKGRVIQTEMLCNPSHLEAVNPFVQGYTRAAQSDYAGDAGRSRVMPIEIHGDAAFAGQGVAFESMCISEMESCGTGGTIHVVCNNQIGFTTDSIDSRSAFHCSSLGRVFKCPVLHVNGDSPEDVVRAFSFAAEFRAHFHKSVVIDLVCYRRYGHNENDDPSITQPRMYERIRSLPDVYTRYSTKLVAEGVLTAKDVTAKAVEEKARYGSYQNSAKDVHYASYLRESIPPHWRDMVYSDRLGEVTMQPTHITEETVRTVRLALRTVPADFELHERVAHCLANRVQCMKDGRGIDWGTAECLAFGSLLMDGAHVAVLGKNADCGTFEQRHAVLTDQNVGLGLQYRKYTPLAHLSDNQGRFTVVNGPVNEYGMLGYSVGYSLYHPNQFVMWEASYGDYANAAAIVFDQFLSSGESKWNQQQSCVVVLPHGFEGEGSDRSSARMERFLQMSSEDAHTPAYSREERAHRVNWEVVYPSTPAQYFHVLRRHMKRNFRKALILFVSKAHMHNTELSTMQELLEGSEFQPVMVDSQVTARAARRLVLCTGQIYHELARVRAERAIGDVALVRLEELSPFPVREVQALLAEYAQAELMWAQEEPRNMGAFAHVEERIAVYTDGERPLAYAGRAISASPATGHAMQHAKEMENITETVFSA